MAQNYELKPQYAGKTLSEIRSDNNLGFRPDVLGNFLGIGENQPITASQYFDINQIPGDYRRGSGELNAFNSIFQSFDPVARAQKQATDAAIESAKRIRQFNIESAQPQIATMQTGKTDLTSRYADLLATIRGDQTTAANKATLNTARELGRRGITGGGLYDTELTSSAQQAKQPFEGLYAQTQTGQTQDINQINNAIAALQAGNPAGALSTSTNISQLSNQAQQIAAQIAQNEAANELERQRIDIAKSQANYIPISGYGIYDLLNKKLLGGLSNSFAGEWERVQ